ncbi:magnesium/cobalt transporter CorA [Mangrovimonas aestuarii]|uniref:magnesium/cobalt transporter CorA n=1 Tax=Mangrovimonas aestuarii TaxID=3018443 RepID=UPI0023792F42|nr:magnesium/cobalt transporter CorA [Mangrovimonas aestuarii]
MVNFVTLENNLIKVSIGVPENIDSVVWLDLIAPTSDEKQAIESAFGVELFTEQESEEIESSSKYNESEDEIGINLNFLSPDKNRYINEPVSFILKGHLIISQRDHEYKAFSDTYRKLKVLKPETGYSIFLTLLETRIDFDADLIENITDQITAISKGLIKEKELEREILLKITALQESTIAIRENIVEKQRLLSAILKSRFFPKEDYETLRIMIKDVGSLLDYTSFNFERLEFLQNTFLGLVDMEQNRIIKIFTVVTVIFMPPTLIASMYGMNFQFMPELNLSFGYPLAICLMITSSILTLLFFKRKKWL